VMTEPRRKRLRRPVGMLQELLAWPMRWRTSVRKGDGSRRKTGRRSLPSFVVGSGWRRIAKRAAPAALAVVCVVALLLALPLLIDDQQRGGGDRSAVWPSLRAPQETPLLDVGGATSVRESFDGLPMDSQLPDPWTVTGQGTAAIVALPTSVDRSVRLVSSVGGAPATACLPVGSVRAPEVTIVVDYQLGRSPPSPVTLLSLESGGARTLALVIDAAGMPIGVASPDGPSGVIDTPPSPSPRDLARGLADWRRVELTVASRSGEVTWLAQDSSGEVTGSGWGEAGGERGAGRIDALCLHSPEGEPSGWVAVDDLVIQG
jgi:hypothetical protein